MVTNDDGVHSNGLIELAKAASKHAEVVVVSPDQPMSASALSLTFHKPLRVEIVRREGFTCHAVSGSPGDCVMIGVNKLLKKGPDLVVSGINFGDNNTFQDILASGTVAAAIEAAILGFPAVAFSMVVRDESIASPEDHQPDYRSAAAIAGEIIRDILDHGFPPGAELLNVNFPSRVSPATEVVITEVGRLKYVQKVLVRRDPRGKPYYWLFGERLRKFSPNSDAEAVLTEGKVSVTPMSLNLSGRSSPELEALVSRVRERTGSKGAHG